MREQPAWRPPSGLSNLRLARLRPTIWSYGYAASPDFVEEWQSVRYVRKEQVCHWCWLLIPVDSPGTKRGTRGTKAYCCVRLGLWRHIECHEEVRAQERDDQRAALLEHYHKRHATPVAGPSNETLHG